MYQKMTNRKKNVFFNLQNGIVQYAIDNGKLLQARLGKRDLDVLLYLINHSGRIVSKHEILDTVWANKIVCENTVSVALSNIRRFIKKADEDCSCLINISGSGYIFTPSKSGFELEVGSKEFEIAS